MVLLRRTIPALVALLPASALAHAGHDLPGAAAGLLHPLSGLDHALAAIAVGLLAVRLGGRLRIGLPAGFIGALAAGAAIAFGGLVLPLSAVAVAGSVVVLGALLLHGRSRPAQLTVALVALVALAHGQAHGLALAESGAGALTAAGFLLTTALLVGTGAALGQMIGTRAGWSRFAGIVIVLAALSHVSLA